MAIEVVPTQKTKKILLTNFILYFCLILLIVFFMSYFVLDIYQRKLKDDLSLLEKKLERTLAEKILEEEILGSPEKIGFQERIRDFNFLIEEHKLPANFFNFLEKITHPKIWYSKFELQLEKNTLDISGQTDSFETLGQQIIIFEKEPLIKNINLSEISIVREGGVKFALQLIFDQKLLK